MDKKEVLIFFPNDHLGYSPTLLSLYHELNKSCNVKIILPLKENHEHVHVENVNTDYFHFGISLFDKAWLFIKYILQKLFSPKSFSFQQVKTIFRFTNAIKPYVKRDAIIIACDYIFLYLTANYFNKINFISLELSDKDFIFFERTDQNKINSVFIQSRVRYDHLFKKQLPHVFLIQNAPTFRGEPKNKTKNGKLMYNGNIAPELGFFHCVEFIQNYPQFQMDARGIITEEQEANIHEKFSDLIDSGKLSLIKDYIPHEELFEFISRYKIGFCFYDINAINENKFNYITAPSGKMFTYFASGVPLIGSNIPGLKPIEEFESGVLIDDYQPETIYNAILKIESNYDFYHKNCFKAAEFYSFEQNVKPYINFLNI